MKYSIIALLVGSIMLVWAPRSRAGSGDMDSNGRFTHDDVTILSEYLLEYRVFGTFNGGWTEIQFRADVNNDGKTDIADLVALRNKTQGAITINVTPDTASWKLTGPAGFTAVSGMGDRLGMNTIYTTIYGTYALHCNTLAALTTPADQAKTLPQGGTIDFRPTYTPRPASLMEMVSVPAGMFLMGNSGVDDDTTGAFDGPKPYNWLDYETPCRKIQLSAYYIGKYEVTNGQFATVLSYAHERGYLTQMNGTRYNSGDVYVGGRLVVKFDGNEQIVYSNGVFSCKIHTGINGGYSMENHPMANVTWDGAVLFCNWLSEMEGLAPCYDYVNFNVLITPCPNGYRLPTEAEWERAAAWDGNKHWVYAVQTNTAPGFERCNWYHDRYANPLGATDHPYTTAVGWFNGININPNGNLKTVDSPSPVGCYDMSGNVWEWVFDRYNTYPKFDQIDPIGPHYSVNIGGGRIVRGGGYGLHWQRIRTADRIMTGSNNYVADLGFRVARYK